MAKAYLEIRKVLSKAIRQLMAEPFPREVSYIGRAEVLLYLQSKHGFDEVNTDAIDFTYTMELSGNIPNECQPEDLSVEANNLYTYMLFNGYFIPYYEFVDDKKCEHIMGTFHMGETNSGKPTYTHSFSMEYIRSKVGPGVMSLVDKFKDPTIMNYPTVVDYPNKLK